MFRIKAWDVTCPQHINPHWTKIQIVPVVAKLKARIAEVEPDNETLRDGPIMHAQRLKVSTETRASQVPDLVVGSLGSEIIPDGYSNCSAHRKHRGHGTDNGNGAQSDHEWLPRQVGAC
jgi:hypothetical protein